MIEYISEGSLLGFWFFDPNNQPRIYFCRVEYSEPFMVAYAFSSLSASGSTNFTRLQDAEKDKILEPRTITEIYHVGIGISPSFVRIYMKEPEDVERFASYKTGISIGANYGYITGADSPYFDPTWEYFAIKGIIPVFGAYNPSSRTITPRLNIEGRKYRVTWLSLSREALERMPASALKKLAADVQRAKIVTKGGVQLIPVPSDLRDYTPISSVYSFLEEVEAILKEKKGGANK